MAFDIFTFEQKQYISLPALHKYLEINCKNQNTAEIANIDILFHLQINEPRFLIMYSWGTCTHQYVYCHTVPGNNVKYFVYANVAAYYKNNWIEENAHYSWQMANEICRNLGVELLYFMSRNGLDEFTSMLRNSDAFPFLEAVFIGLIYNGLKVGLHKVF